MADDNNEIKTHITIKRIKKVKGGHHGGSWKIAYADFVTAMMAFFLLMWLLSMMNKYQLQGIAEYFKKPLLKEKATRQDDVAKTNSLKETLGPTLFKESGLKDQTPDSPDKNLGHDEAKVEAITQQGVPQSPADTEAAQKQKAADEAVQQKQMQQLTALKAELEAKLKNDPAASEFKNSLNFVLTSDGLKIIIHDLENKPMFSKGKTDFERYAKNILSWLTQQVNAYPNKVMVIGHTDNIPYANQVYGNWELSTARANATRQSLIKNGMNSDRILRVVGSADTHPLQNHNGNDPANRRIDIILLTDQAVKNIQNQQ